MEELYYTLTIIISIYKLYFFIVYLFVKNLSNCIASQKIFQWSGVILWLFIFISLYFTELIVTNMKIQKFIYVFSERLVPLTKVVLFLIFKKNITFFSRLLFCAFYFTSKTSIQVNHRDQEKTKKKPRKLQKRFVIFVFLGYFFYI